jgi:uncharacterized membrane protein YoaK (UPF0700 family)
MSGNSAKLGVRLTHGKLIAALPLALAVGCFVVSIALGTVILEATARRGLKRIAAVVLVLEGALVAAFMAYGSMRGSNAYGLITLAVFALGLQAAAVQQVRGRVVRTTYVSGVLTSFAQEAVNAFAPPAKKGTRSYVRDVLGAPSRAASRRRAAVLLSVWLIYAAGAVLGSFLEAHWQLWSLGVPLAVLTLVVGIDVRRPLYS